MNKKMAREIVESLPSLYPSMTTDEEEAIWTVLATNSNTENDGDCISRQAAIDALRTCYDTETVTMDNGDEYINYGDAVGEIEQLPPAQPETTTMTVGRTKGEITMWYECDNCGEPVDQRDNYCPNCGRKFRKNE